MSDDSTMGLLAAALAKAQGQFPPIPRDRTVTVRMQSGGAYTFAYAPLDTILGACRAALSTHGLAIVQTFEAGHIRTVLMHSGGGRVESCLSLPQIAEMQRFGSTITYLRRYAITAILGVAAEDDDDGNHASGHTAEQVARPRPVQKPVAPAPAAKPGLSVETKRFHSVRDECGLDDARGKAILAEFGLASSMDVTSKNVEKIVLRMRQFAGMEPPPVGEVSQPERVKAVGQIVKKLVEAARPLGPLDVTCAIGSVAEKATKGGSSWTIGTDNGEYRTFSRPAADAATALVGQVAVLRIVENRGYRYVTAVEPYTPPTGESRGVPDSMDAIPDSDIPF